MENKTLNDIYVIYEPVGDKPRLLNNLVYSNTEEALANTEFNWENHIISALSIYIEEIAQAEFNRGFDEGFEQGLEQERREFILKHITE